MEKFKCVEIFHDKFLFFSDRISKIPRKSNTHDVLRSLRFTIYEMHKNSFSISLETNACQWGSWILDYHIFIHSHMHTSNSKSNKNAKCHLFGRAQCVWIIPRMMRIQMMCENIMALHTLKSEENPIISSLRDVGKCIPRALPVQRNIAVQVNAINESVSCVHVCPH